MKNKKSSAIFSELKEHLPFTLLVSLFAGALVAVLYFVGRVPTEELFEIAHPAHILVSAAATAGIYWKYAGRVAANRLPLTAWMKTVLVGVSGAILIGALSDVLLPFFGGRVFGLETAFHLPLLEMPVLILGLSFLGAVIGMYFDVFKLTHSLHVFLSVFASLFYLLAFSVELSAAAVLLMSGLVFLVVYIPCCLSDIVFPLFFIDKPCVGCGHFH
jgi:hypothetical protein